MTLGGLIVAGAITLALVAAVARGYGWARALLVLWVVVIVSDIRREGLQPDVFVVGADGWVNVFGGLLGAATCIFVTGLPRRLEYRLWYGPLLRELRFDCNLVRVRQPFVDAARALDAAMRDKSRWRHLVTEPPPGAAWSRMADDLARSDRDWVDAARSGAPGNAWLAWQAWNDQVGATWKQLREPLRERGERAAKVVRRVGLVGGAVAIACVVVGWIGLPSAIASAPPQGRAAFVPERPAGHGVTLVPLGTLLPHDLVEFVSFYRARYDLPVAVSPTVAVPREAFDAARGQFVGEDLVAAIRSAQPLARSDNQVVIGVVAEDMYLRFRPDWRFAFGITQGNVGVISTARMGTTFELLDNAVERARLRKMVTRYIGLLLFGLERSADRNSVLYDPILSRDDLDRMGEDYR